MPARRPAANPRTQGPDLSWADEHEIPDPEESHHNAQARSDSPPRNVPGPLFPSREHRNKIRTPKPLSAGEQSAASYQLQFRRRCREGPLFTVLDQNVLLVDGVHRKSEEARRKGFDPFAGQERYSTRHVKRARTEPDLGTAGRGDYGYSLAMFPEELWGMLDPEGRLPDWEGKEEGSVARRSLLVGQRGRGMRDGGRKRKGLGKIREEVLNYEDMDREKALQVPEDDEEDEDVIDGAARKKRATKDKIGRQEGVKRGLDAEDDVAAERDRDGEGEEGEGGEADLQETDYSEDDDEPNDYDAEKYFSGGEDEDDGGDDYGGGDDY